MSTADLENAATRLRTEIAVKRLALGMVLATLGMARLSKQLGERLMPSPRRLAAALHALGESEADR